MTTPPPPRPSPHAAPQPDDDATFPAREPEPPAGAAPRHAPARWNLPPRLVSCRLHPTGVLLDVPVSGANGSQIVVSTAWPDPNTRAGWTHQNWRPTQVGRGYEIPRLTDLGDVIAITEWHTNTAPTRALPGARRGLLRRDPAKRLPVAHATWWGYLHAIETDALILHGPFPDPVAAHGVAQQAYLRKLHQPTGATQPTRAGHAQPAGRVPIYPATPPATVSVTYDGPNTVVGDPTYGWLTAASDRFHNALAVPGDQLRALLHPHYGELHPTTAHATLAALAARHTPDQLPDICLPTTATTDPAPLTSTTRLADVTGRPDPYRPNPTPHTATHRHSTDPATTPHPTTPSDPSTRPDPSGPTSDTPPDAHPAAPHPRDVVPEKPPAPTGPTGPPKAASAPFLPDLSDYLRPEPPAPGSDASQPPDPSTPAENPDPPALDLDEPDLW
ncbi:MULTISPECIES: hypothetical protein [unclassified Pseudofrankia]|uniref:hypothetical protein n=1 Tax=unclassified Pseudofrankia TaxID=2994372 RepID=UPI0008D9866A|nr:MULTISPECIES: hypothetical protein [unclassified Pseudofrankia]MDT3444456.1 hypothetical protein [Pseudofrankia sp. BMG5.37]OHV57983.1 hypothetical protein BCD48_42670 [Pseudofrankia sp. BMG5.36]